AGGRGPGADPGESGRLPQAAAGRVVVTARERLAELGIELPKPAAPMASYVPAVRTGDLVYTSGQVPLVDGVIAGTGKVGEQVSVADAAGHARTCALNALAAIDALVGIDAVRR